MLEFKVALDFAGVRLDKFLKKTLPNIPTSHLFKMIRVKKIRVNGKRAKPDQHLAADDVVTVRGSEEQLKAERERAPAPSPPVDTSELKILLQDDWLMVIDKPSGMAVHTGSGITGGTVVDVVRAHLGPKAVRNEFAASPAHRLDRDTSGVLIVALRRPAMVHFTDVFTHHKAKKRYLAVLKGKLEKSSGVIDTPLAEHQQTRESRERRGVNLQDAVTRYRVLASTEDLSFVEATIETGRTHQIRRHFASIEHPVVGDDKHGDFPFNRVAKSKWGIKRMFLHAGTLTFPHPADGRRITVESPLPPELSAVLQRAGLEVERRPHTPGDTRPHGHGG